MKTDFHRILIEKMDANSAVEAQKPTSMPENLDPLHLSFLLSTIPKLHTKPTGLASRNLDYLLKSKVFSSQKLKQHTKHSQTINSDLNKSLMPPTPPPQFTPAQKEAWLWFWRRGTPLTEKFTENELQRQFRKLAQILHPDKNHHPMATTNFIQLREHYNILRTTF